MILHWQLPKLRLYSNLQALILEEEMVVGIQLPRLQQPSEEQGMDVGRNRGVKVAQDVTAVHNPNPEV